MIESVCTILNDGQDPLNTMNMELYVHVWGRYLMYVYLDMTGTTYWWKNAQSWMYI